MQNDFLLQVSQGQRDTAPLKQAEASGRSDLYAAAFPTESNSITYKEQIYNNRLV